MTESVARSRALYFCLPLSGSLSLSLLLSFSHPPALIPSCPLALSPPLSRPHLFPTLAHALPHSCETPLSSWYTLSVSLVRISGIRNVPPLAASLCRLFHPRVFNPIHFLSSSRFTYSITPLFFVSFSLACSFLLHLPSSSASHASSIPFHLAK